MNKFEIKKIIRIAERIESETTPENAEKIYERLLGMEETLFCFEYFDDARIIRKIARRVLDIKIKSEVYEIERLAEIEINKL